MLRWFDSSDGLQHLESVDAYRRDRRKDLLLQENGCVVLRFLADHVRRHLDTILDPARTHNAPKKLTWVGSVIS